MPKQVEQKSTVKIAEVKTPIMYTKRRLHNYLKENKLEATTSTHTKPVLKSTADVKAREKVVKELKSIVVGMEKKYKLEAPQMARIDEQLEKHTKNYLTPKN